MITASQPWAAAFSAFSWNVQAGYGALGSAVSL
jgi:hypothetical protein